MVRFVLSGQYDVSDNHRLASCFYQTLETKQPILPSPSVKWKYQLCPAMCAVSYGLGPAEPSPLSLWGSKELREADLAVRGGITMPTELLLG